jgi:hypothetical protein
MVDMGPIQVVMMLGDTQRLRLVRNPPPPRLGLQDQGDEKVASRARFQISQPELKDKWMMT